MPVVIQALRLFVILTLLTGLAYPLIVTGISQLVFPHQANGSLIKDTKDANVVIGSELIGQDFRDAKYFWGRPSGTSPSYNAGASSGANLGPINPELTKRVKATADKLKSSSESSGPIPVDLVTASSSGLDPHISVEAAIYQAERVARARNVDPQRVKDLIKNYSEGRQFGLLGEERVNVVMLNIALDRRSNE